MNELLKVVLSLSLSGSLLILVLFFCKPLLKHRISKRWQYYIWLVVVARLLLPFTLEVSPVGTLFGEVDRAVIQADTIPIPGQNIAPATEPEDGTAIGNDTTMQNDNAPKTATLTFYKVLTVVLQNLWLIWLMVALILLIRKITIYQGFVRYIRAGHKEVSDIALLDRLALLGEQVGVKKPVELFTNELISSPLLHGFFWPCIVLPTADLPESDFQYTILHELTHYKRRDMFYKWLVQIAICLHWFNPLVYLMGREVGRACELSCDEAVIRKLDAKEHRAYGDTLLNAIGVGGSYKDSLASVTLNESKELLKERLDAIMKFKKTTRLTATISLALVFALCFTATAVGAYAAAPYGGKGNSNTATMDLTDIRIIREGGVYYILCDGADESNKPTSGVTEGSIMFVLVRKNSYTSISGFNNIEKLVDEVMEQCDYMLKKRSITQDEARLIVEIATKIQSGNDSDFIDQKAEIFYAGEYAQWEIEKINGAYYYQDERIRIFMDLRADNSFVNFSYDKLGTVDLRLIREKDGKITKAEYLPKTEADEILNDLDVVHSSTDMEDVSRLSKGMVPEGVLNVINSCDIGVWYVIVGNEYQYIYYNGLPHNYAWQPEFKKGNASIGIFDIGKSTGTYVLLKIPANLKLTISYNSKQIAYEKIET